MALLEEQYRGNPAGIIGPIAGFGVFAAASLGVITAILRRIPPVPVEPTLQRW